MNSKQMDKIVNTPYEEIIQQPYGQHHMNMKPHGLWYCYGNDWVESGIREVHPYTFKLDIDFTDILVIDSHKKLWEVIDKYSASIGKELSEITVLSWEAVAKDYKGVDIPNYCRWWKHRDMNAYAEEMRGFSGFGLTSPQTIEDIYCTTWYTAWDFNSGCIWDLSAIKGYEKNSP